jgi:gluconokinase
MEAQNSSHSPALPRAPSVLYFYGLAGVGKNFVGDIAGRLTGRHVYHADVDLTEEMRKAIADQRPFTPEMRDRYYAIVADRIAELRREHGALVVTQGTYKNQHRDYLMSRVPDMDMICVVADDALILDRLRARGSELTPDYAARIKANFEPPAKGAKTILNNAGEDEIAKHLASLYG